MASRGRDGADVLKLTPKSELKERLGRSPDLLDAAYMAVWARDSGVTAGIPTASVSIGDDPDDVDDEDKEFEDSEIGQALQDINREMQEGPF